MPARRNVFVRVAFLALPIFLRGQETPAPPTPAAPPPPDVSESSAGPLHLNWVSIGFRIPVLLEPEIKNRTIETSTSSPQTTTKFTTTGTTPRVALGLVFEFPLHGKFTIASEVLFHHVSYTQQHTYVQGDPSSSSAITTTWTERTKASEWEFPVMLRYNGIRQHGLFSKVYVAGGGIFKTIVNVRTGNEYDLQAPDVDDVTDYNEIRMTPANRDAFGVVIAAGLRFIDEFHIRVTPEIRYIHWSDRTFDVHSTASSLNQFQAGIALTF